MIILIVFIVITLLFGPGLWAKYVISKYNKDAYFSGNGFDLARLLLEQTGITQIPVEVSPAGDHYDPIERIVRLSQKNCGKNTLTAVVVAAHEAGHAIQDYFGYGPLRTRTRILQTSSRIERMGIALVMGAPVITAITKSPSLGVLTFVGAIAALCMPVLVHLFTLPTEFDASFNRALPLLAKGNYIPPEDFPAARKILLACALTYVAGALMSLLNIWRWLRILKR